MKLLHFESVIDHVKWLFFRAKAGQRRGKDRLSRHVEIFWNKKAFRYYMKQIDSMLPCVSFSNRELTNQGVSHDGAVESPYSTAPLSCRNLNLRFAVKTTMFMRNQQIFSPFLKFVFIFWEGELLKPNCLTSDKRELVSHTLMEAAL